MSEMPKYCSGLVKTEFILCATKLHYLSVVKEKVITDVKCSAASMSATVEFEKGACFCRTLK